MSPMMVATRGFKDSISSILLFLLLIGYPVVLFAFLKLFGHRYFETNTMVWLVGSVLICGTVIMVYGVPGMLLNLKKGIPNNGYFIAESAVYLDGRQIPEAEPSSFEVFTVDSRYAKCRKRVFFEGRIISEADSQSFVPIENVEAKENTLFGTDNIPHYWKDDFSIFFNGEKIKDADARSFKLLSGWYATDARHVFYENKILEDAVPEHFTILGDGVTTDEKSIYIFDKKSATAADISSFEVIEDENDTFCRDKNNVFVLFYSQKEPLVKVAGADVSTFKPLERSYAIDKNSVYFYGYTRFNVKETKRLTGANPKSFHVGYDDTTESDGRDGSRYYMSGEEVKP